MEDAPDDLLEGLEGSDREQREELLRYLVDDEGFSMDEIREATSPMLLPARRVIDGGGDRLSAHEVSDRSGQDVDLLLALMRAMGLPAAPDLDAKLYGGRDVELARLGAKFLDLMDRDDVLTVTRVLGHGLSQTAEVMRQATLAAVLQPGASELELTRAYTALVENIAPMLEPLLGEMLRLQLMNTLETEALNATERAAGRLPGARDVTVLFADVVGFTSLGEALEPDALERVARRLEDLARDVAAGPVRFIKTIGDAVMLVCPDASALLDAAFALLDRVADDDEMQLRVGLASGPAVSRAGDWFGRPVNLASRVTSVARPDSVLVTEAVRDALDASALRFSFAGERHLKGVNGAQKLFRARPAEGS